MSFLLDTYIISELRQGPRCHPGVANWFDAIEDRDIYLSVLRLVLLEILVWKERRLGLNKVLVVKHHIAPNTSQKAWVLLR